jgi:hypothetical protein
MEKYNALIETLTYTLYDAKYIISSFVRLAVYTVHRAVLQVLTLLDERPSLQ